MSVLVRLYRAALLLLPPRFRREYGPALLEAARTRLAEESTAGGRARASLALGLDLAGAALREWWDVMVEGGRTGTGGGMSSDVRWALRALGRSPGFAAAVVGTLGLGIGATTVALGLVETYLLRSMPYPEGDRLVAVWPRENWSGQMFDLAQRGLPSLQGVAAAGGLGLVLEEGGEPVELFATWATTNLFGVLGVRPVLGRGLLPEDAVPGAEPVAILSHRLWTERFASDPSVIGRAIALGGEGHQRRTVVGVMPEDHLPLQGEGVDAWVPVTLDPAASSYSESYFMQAVGRLSPGATPENAARDVLAWAARLAELEPEWFTPERVRGASAVPLAAERTSDRHTAVLLALGAALLVLLVACANVANLVVARTIGRERELSVRAALGAGRLRTARVVVAEVAVLAAAGAVAGLGIAAGLVRLIERRFADALPDWGLELDPRWALAAVATAALAASVAGLVPALHAAEADPARAMAGGRGASGHRRLTRVQEVLSGLQLALATAGIAAMSLLGRSLLALGDVDPGLDAAHAVTFRVTAPPTAFPEDGDVVRFFRDARTALAAVPGVEVVGFGSRLPLAGGESRITVTPEGRDFAEGEARPVAWHRLVTPGYLEALGARLVEGRIPGVEDDRDDAPELVVINRSASSAFWPEGMAVGKRFYGPGRQVWLEVAGVVDDVLENGQTRPAIPGLYIPHRDWPWRTLYAVVRTRQDPATLVPELKRAVWTVSSGVPIARVTTLDEVVARGLRPTRTLTVLAAVAGAVTVLLGALGIYGVISHAAARRLRELGVRAALGADRGRLLVGELARATRIVAPGLAAGVFLAWLCGRAMRGVLYGVGALDPPSLAVALAVLGAVGYLAAYLPARKASAVDPARVMRME